MKLEIVKFGDDAYGIRKTVKEGQYMFAKCEYGETFKSWTKLSNAEHVRHTNLDRLRKMLASLISSEDIGEPIK